MAIVAGAGALRMLVMALFDGSAPFLIMLCAVVLSAWIGGWGPGLFATGLGVLAARHLPPSAANYSLVNDVVFLTEGILISLLAQRLRLEQSRRMVTREQMRLLYEGIDVCALFMLDPSGRVDDWDQRATEMFGFDADDIIGSDFSRLYADEQGAATAAADLEKARSHGLATVAGWRQRKDGKRFWGEAQLTALRDAHGEIHAFAFVVSDKTERKKAEEQLEDYRTRLEELVAERTRALHESMTRLRLSERMAALGTLSAGLGHDMGNLLLPIRLRLDAMLAKGVPESMREHITAISTCADYLQRLSNGLRLLSIDPGQMDATPPTTNLNDWWQDAQPLLKNSLRRGIELDRRIPEDLPAIAVPRHLLTQAVFNLVQNAGHAIPAQHQGRVCVWAESAADGERIRVGVTDDGAGMSPDVLARCLEPFFTSKTRAISTGLGLTLVHGIVQQAGGDIEIKSKPGEGATFILTFPVAPTTVAKPVDDGEHRLPHRASVAVADLRMRSYLGAVLKSVGFEVGYGLPTNAADEALLVADDSVATSSVSTFVGEGVSGRRCLILGQRPDAADLQNVVVLNSRPAPAELRAAAAESARRIREFHSGQASL